MFDYRWNDWNILHIAEHNLSPEDAEYVVDHARPPYPERTGNDKVLVRGQARSGQYIQVIYVVDRDDMLYVIHARPLTENEKRRYRRRRK
jgi:uncharacterized DUF497 family protein